MHYERYEITPGESMKRKTIVKMESELERGLRLKMKKADKSLDKYLEKGLFKVKVAEANEVLRTVGLPEIKR
jgi:hypothetical protein